MRVSTLLEWGAILGIFLIAILVVLNIGVIVPSAGSGVLPLSSDSAGSSPGCMDPETGGFFQDTLSAPQPVVRQIDEWTFTLHPVYRYTIIGKVVGKDTYASGPSDTLSPMDFAIATGDIIRPEISRYITIRKTPRHYHYQYFFPAGTPQLSPAYINEHISNNHLIFADDSLSVKAQSVNVGDYVRIRGYLVTVSGQSRDGRTYHQGTSTTRSDQSEGACEVVYIETLEKLPC
jgi:hypothetical protein